ncbi:DNA helicase/exodeoxyribonuclease V, gamma subunit [Allopseudospirillum japonicum]|uniref:RecBCD enzyme subunit RecC n=1 Tax=Allopseudospirillum japonicum TaxID=64971 RepID=A0A1H6Q6A4_9GAMM|nr:exodeoxyribonuclease V subunit gamma [Allopseudospirillum japonicum]SEI37416.1 DNA helicase/exodeoxyribonuclease V, gamma subunit [Allopseudospirillum japonicum]
MYAQACHNTAPLTPGFMVLHSHRMEALRDLVLEWISQHPLAPLENEVFLVQSNGIAQWLKLALAQDEACGIAAAVDIQLPARFFWQVYRAYLGDRQVPKHSPMDKAPLTWRLFQLLPQLSQDPRFAELEAQQALNHQDANARYALAQSLADLFDQYQVYRAHWLQDWQQNRFILQHPMRAQAFPLPEEHQWQAYLWQEVQASLPKYARTNNRAHLHQAFLQTAAKGHLPLNKLPRRVLVFGISSLPVQSVQILQALAKHLQVIICVHNPCRFYWGDLISDQNLVWQLNKQARRQAEHHHVALAPSLPPLSKAPRHPSKFSFHNLADLHQHAHPLLAAWGRQGRDYIHLLEEADHKEAYAHLFQRIDLFDYPPADSMLAVIQEDILELRSLQEIQAQPRNWQAATDHSIRFHSAHTKHREVEILQDQLLALFQQHPDLQPKDVIVMMPQVDTYVAAIQAVFGQVDPQDPRYLPYALADRQHAQHQNLILALESLLNLQEHKCTFSQLFQLLEVPAIRARFGLQEKDLPLIRTWLEQAGARWGLNAHHRKALGLQTEFNQNTWAFALERLWLGYALGDQSQPWQGLYPYADIGGLDAPVLGLLDAWFRRLLSYVQHVQEAREPQAWVSFLHQVLEDFFLAQESSEALLLEHLHQTLDAWLETCQRAEFSQPLPIKLVAHVWLQSLQTDGVAQRFLGGAINFCTLMPMRAIPFQVVCLLGMNEADYPRQRTVQAFDLMALYPQAGDRARRDDDRYLFLEALLSARRHLHISWLGRDAQDNSERMPSVLVGQLRDYIQQGWQLPPELAKHNKSLLDYLTYEHPLQAFSPQYFLQAAHTCDQHSLFSYNPHWRALYTGEMHTQGLPLPHTHAGCLAGESTETKLDLETLSRFFAHPVDYFCRHHLGAPFYYQELIYEDLEPFTLDPLQNYQIRDFLLKQVLSTLIDTNQPHTLSEPEHAPIQQHQIQHSLQQALDQLQGQGRLPCLHFAQPLREAFGYQITQLVENYQEVRRLWFQQDQHPVQVSMAAHTYQAADLAEISLEDAPQAYPELLDWVDALHQDHQGKMARIHLYPHTLATNKDKIFKINSLASFWLEYLALCVQQPQPSFHYLVLALDQTLCWPAMPPQQAQALLHDICSAWQYSQHTPLPLAPRSSMTWLHTYYHKQGDTNEALAQARQVYHAETQIWSRPECAPGSALSEIFPHFEDLQTADEGFVYWTQKLYQPLFAHLKKSLPLTQLLHCNKDA